MASVPPRSGYIDCLTTEEAEALAALKESGDTTGYTDPDLCRFLRARSFDVGKAREMLDEDIRWRTDFNPKSFKFDDDEVNRHLMSGKFKTLGKDRSGKPSCIFRSALHVGDSEATLKALLYVTEKYIEHEMKDGVERVNVVFDLSNYGYANVDNTFTKSMVDAFQDHYPERLNRAFILNAPYFFKIVWKVIYTFLDKNTREKVFFATGDFQTEFLEMWPPESLPIEWGGLIEGLFDDDCDHVKMFTWPKEDAMLEVVEPEAIPSPLESASEAAPIATAPPVPSPSFTPEFEENSTLPLSASSVTVKAVGGQTFGETKEERHKRRKERKEKRGQSEKDIPTQNLPPPSQQSSAAKGKGALLQDEDEEKDEEQTPFVIRTSLTNSAAPPPPRPSQASPFKGASSTPFAMAKSPVTNTSRDDDDTWSSTDDTPSANVSQRVRGRRDSDGQEFYSAQE